MLSKIPIDLSKVREKDIDREILRTGIIAEYDAINLYEQMAAFTENKDVKRIMLDVAKEVEELIGK